MSLRGHPVLAREQRYIFQLVTWAEVLKELYSQSYQAGRFRAQDPATILKAYELRVEVLDKLIDIVSSYPDRFVSLVELKPSLPMPR